MAEASTSEYSCLLNISINIFFHFLSNSCI